MFVWIAEDILAALERWSFKEALPADAYKKVCKEIENQYIYNSYGLTGMRMCHYAG